MRAPGLQRGSFAIAAVLMLLVVVAVSMRLLVEVSQGVASRSHIALESTQAALMADSGLETALALLEAGGGRLTDCDSALLGSATPATGLSYSVLATPLPGTREVSADCHPEGVAPVCRVTAIGTAGQARRNANVDLGNCSPLDSGEKGVGGDGNDASDPNPIRLRIQPRSSPSVVVVNLAAAVTHPLQPYRGNLIDFKCESGSSLGCQESWELQYGVGTPAVLSKGFVALETSLSSYELRQYLYSNVPGALADRHFATAGAIFEGAEIARILSNDANITVEDYTVSSESNNPHTLYRATNAAPDKTGWCEGADTIVFGVTLKGEFSSNITRLAVTGATIQTPPALPALPTVLELKPLQRGVVTYDGSTALEIPYTEPMTSGNVVFSEIWYGSADAETIRRLFSAEGNAEFTLNLDSDGTISSNFRWAGGFACLSGVDPTTARSIANTWRPLVWWERYEND